MSDLVVLNQEPFGITLRLAAPRANALEPEFLDTIRSGLDEIERSQPEKILISGGRNFCSGGDVARFAQAVAEGQGANYARQVVPKLQDIVLRLVTLPSIVGLATRGAITGGGAGFLFAADMVAAHPTSFAQPYYSKVGFAPDGGWSALLPERIGAGLALDWLMQDRRRDAQALLELGLVTCVSKTPEATATELLNKDNVQTQIAAKQLIWDDARLSLLKVRLDAETQAFLDRINEGDTQQGMAQFLRSV